MKRLLFVIVLAVALLPAAGLAQDGNNQGQNNNNQGITATEMSEVGLALASFLGAVAYFGIRRRAQSKK